MERTCRNGERKERTEGAVRERERESRLVPPFLRFLLPLPIFLSFFALFDAGSGKKRKVVVYPSFYLPDVLCFVCFPGSLSFSLSLSLSLSLLYRSHVRLFEGTQWRPI